MWEGDTLVVRIRGFRAGVWLDAKGSPLSDAGTITERFSASSVPYRPRQPTGVVVELYAARRMHLRDQDDLSEVIGEVLDDVQDCIEDRQLAALDSAQLGQIRNRQTAQHPIDIIQRAIERRKQFPCRRAFTRGKFGGTVPDIRFAAYAADDPLSNVAGQVQQQIADAVGRLVGTPPQGIGRQRFDRQPDLRSILKSEAVTRPFQRNSREL
jgi:hypothetical protein